jgi:hypothetical protein
MAELRTHLATERVRVVALRLKQTRPSSIPTSEAVVTLAPLYIAQKPIAACHGKQLKLHDQGGAVFAAHKQMFVGVAFALGVGDVRNTAHGPGIGSEPTTLRLTVARTAKPPITGTIAVNSENTALRALSGAAEC